MPADAAPAFLYAPELGAAGSTLTLSPEESHYLSHVCRARPGDSATATNGRGTVAGLRLEVVTRVTRAEVQWVRHVARTRRAWLLCGAPDEGRADWLVEKLAELGIEAWQPLQCERAQWRGRSHRPERWRRLAIAAMRQSRRSVLMEIRDPVRMDSAVEALPAEASRWLASQEGPWSGTAVRATSIGVGAVGPAGGFTQEEEVRLRDSGFAPIRLSDGRLRTETAALAWAAWWAASG